MSLDRRAAALALAEEIIGDMELDRARAEALLMKCLRLARLLQDDFLQQVASLELRGYKDTTESGWAIARSVGRGTTRTVDGKEQPWCWVASLPLLCRQIVDSETMLSLQKLPDDLSYSYARGQVTSPYHVDQPNLGAQIVYSIQQKQQQLANEIGMWKQVVVAVKASLYDYVVRLLHELKYSAYVATALDAVRQAVDGKLKDIAPQALKQFSAAFDSGLSGNPEHWSQALTSCRRILKSLADAVFPPRDEEYVTYGGSKLKVGRDQYRNRLSAFIDLTRRGDTGGRLLSLEVDALDSLLQKGVHGEVDEREAQIALTRTYFLVGDVLALCPPGFTLTPAADDDGASA